MGKALDAEAWIATRERRDPDFRRRVEEELAVMLLEQNLIRLREARNLSPAQLTRRLGVTRQAVQSAEFEGLARLTVRRLIQHVVALRGRLEVVMAKPIRAAQDRRRGSKLVPEERQAIARKAARAR